MARAECSNLARGFELQSKPFLIHNHQPEECHMARDKRTGAIGVENYQWILEAIPKGVTAVVIADLLNINQETVRKFARKRGLTMTKHDQTMENHPMWEGGTTRDRSGYLLQRVAKDGPHGYLIRAIAKRGLAGTDQSGYAPVHRIVMHDKLGRRLVAGEVVDHIDGDHQNNHPYNLRVFASNADHLRVTLKGKVPNWTPEGFARMTGRPAKNQG